MNADFDSYRLGDEHEALREAVRALAEKEIAPHAAEVDEQGRYPDRGRRRADQGRLPRDHIPEEYGGQGADELAGCIVIEEVARVCASSSLIPAVNRLGLTPILLSGVARAEAAGPAVDRHRRGDDQLRAVRAGGRLGRGGDAHPGPSRRRRLGAQRHQVLDHQRRGVQLVHGDGGDRPGPQRPTASPRSSVHADDPGFEVGPKERKLGINGSPTREIYFTDCRIPADRIIGEPGTGFKTALATLDHTRPTIGAQAVGIAQGALDVAVAIRQGAPAVRPARSPSSRACSS